MKKNCFFNFIGLFVYVKLLDNSMNFDLDLNLDLDLTINIRENNSNIISKIFQIIVNTNTSDVKSGNALEIIPESIELFLLSKSFVLIAGKYNYLLNDKFIDEIYKILLFFKQPENIVECLEQIKICKYYQLSNIPYYLLSFLFNFIRTNHITNITDFENFDIQLILYFLCNNSKQMELDDIINYAINFSIFNYTFNIAHKNFIFIIPIRNFNGFKMINHEKMFLFDAEHLYGIAFLCVHNNFDEIKLIIDYACSYVNPTQNEYIYSLINPKSSDFEKINTFCFIKIKIFFEDRLERLALIALEKNSSIILNILVEFEKYINHINHINNYKFNKYILINYAIQLNNIQMLIRLLSLKLYHIDDLIGKNINYTIVNNYNECFMIIYTHLQKNEYHILNNFFKYNLIILIIQSKNSLLFNWIVKNMNNFKELIFSSFTSVINEIAKNDSDDIFEILFVNFTNKWKYSKIIEFLSNYHAHNCIEKILKYKPDDQ